MLCKCRAEKIKLSNTRNLPFVIMDYRSNQQVDMCSYSLEPIPTSDAVKLRVDFSGMPFKIIIKTLRIPYLIEHVPAK